MVGLLYIPARVRKGGEITVELMLSAIAYTATIMLTTYQAESGLTAEGF